MSWKRLLAIMLSTIVMYYMTRFTLAHLKEGGMVWWGGWIGVGLFVAAVIVIMKQLKAACFQNRRLNQLISAARVSVLIATLVFLWEAIARGIPLSPDLLPAPSVLWG